MNSSLFINTDDNIIVWDLEALKKSAPPNLNLWKNTKHLPSSEAVAILYCGWIQEQKQCAEATVSHMQWRNEEVPPTDDRDLENYQNPLTTVGVPEKRHIKRHVMRHEGVLREAWADFSYDLAL